jgi:hypothetical protein
VIPNAGHFTLFSEPERVITIVKHFLEESKNRISVATARTGYHPDETSYFRQDATIALPVDFDTRLAEIAYK